MLALLYVIIACVLGDAICRRFFTFASVAHRFAAAMLSGLLVSTWGTYGFAYLFKSSSSPMLWGNAAFAIAALAAIILLKWRLGPGPIDEIDPSTEFLRWDWIFTGIFLVVATWMMFSTFNVSGDRLQIGNHQWSDFGSNVSIMQSFAVGHNFPTEYPHFSGERIRYHFLFYFQAGNLEYLGLNPALANNLLSIVTLVAMLIMVMTLGAVLFGSRLVGRIGAALFFFHGSLAYVPFLAGTTSVSDAISKIWSMKSFLPSGLPYRGEDWGVWSQVVYLNQRHFASSIGLLLMVLVFLVIRYNSRPVSSDAAGEPDTAPELDPEHIPAKQPDTRSMVERFAPFAAAGCLLGLLPMWNGAVFAAAAVVFAVMFLLLPLKKEMLVTGITAGILALPQVIYLKSGAKTPDYSLFNWGYTVDDPTAANVAYYLFFTFGFKWILIGAALAWGTGLQRKVMIALTSLIALAFFFQFSEEVLANHKFLNIWLVGANLFVAFGMVKLWDVSTGTTRLPARALAAVLLLLVTIGGAIDLVVIKNTYWVEMKLRDDRLLDWIKANTDPRSIFLSNRYVNHAILLAGRPLFYGHPYYAWGAGYPTIERDKVYKKMFESRNAAEVFRLIKENNISYIAIDDSLRKNDFVRVLNEKLFEQNFSLVFEDTERRYDNMRVFRVPDDLDPSRLAAAPTLITPQPPTAVANAFEGGEGAGGGQFLRPRGIGTDAAGNIYVADTGNSRVQKFTADGIFLMAIGTSGQGEGELKEPNGVAVDTIGNIYVVDAFNHKLVRYGPDGRFNKEWRGPAPGFYGPRDVAIGPNNHLYIVDQGRTRVVRFDPATEAFTSWGTSGAEAGQFLEPTGIGIGGGSVFVCDLGNDRIQVFDLDGKFLHMWGVPKWEKYPWHYPDAAFDESSGRLYVTNGLRNEMLVFNKEGGPAEPAFERTLDLRNPSSISLVRGSGLNRLMILNTESARVEAVSLVRTR